MREPGEVLVVVAKAPVPGRSKTRLQSSFSPEEAAALAEAALADTLCAVARTPARRRVVVLDGKPGPWLPPGFEVVPQVAGGLGARLGAGFATVLDGDPGPALLVGMDTPQLTPELLSVDFEGRDALLGLAVDGGFWAIGLRRAVPGLFEGVPMSSPTTGAAQLARLRSLGLSVGLLPTVRDVDVPADAAAVAALAPRSRFARLHRRLGRPGERLLHPLVLFENALCGLRVLSCVGDLELELPAARWRADPDGADEALLARVEPPALDLGCGPGRLVTALTERNVPALGVDVSQLAVAMTGARGGVALHSRLDERLPDEGSWGTVLLADGNVGIGCDPGGLLQRCRELLRPGGLLLVEADPNESADVRDVVVLRDEDGRTSHPLPWARVGSGPLRRIAADAGFTVAEEWCADGRVLLALRAS